MRSVFVSSFLAASATTSLAFAGDPPPEYGEAPRAAPPAYSYEPAPVPPPLGHRGFQLAIRTGVAIPFGSAKDEDANDTAVAGARSELSDLAGPQIPVAIDLGAKPNKHVFIGAYVSLGFGLAAGALSDACDQLQRDCRSTSFRVGGQIHYSIAPDERLNPWVGYGLGLSWLTVGDDGARTQLRGFDFGRFMAGLDIRVSRTVGLGPFADFAIGKYAGRTIETASGEVDEDLQGRAFHYWLTIGPRVVFFP